MAHPHRTYQPRDTEHSVLHAVIREHLEPFLQNASDRGDGHGLPRFVEQEFREFLTCGVLAQGFTRLQCADCTFERLVPFSCCPELKTIWSLPPEVRWKAARSARTGSSGTQASCDYDDWLNFLGNKHMVTALLSRLRHQCTTIKIDGPSLREPQG